MKKILPSLLFCVVTVAVPFIGRGQSFTVPHDTVYITVNNAGSGNTLVPADPITNTSAPSGLSLKWHVDTTNFPAAWLASGAFGICDNVQCYSNTDDTLWNPATEVSHTFISSPYVYNTPGEFNLSLNLPNTIPAGTYYVVVTVTDPNSFYSKNVVFIIGNTVTAVPVVSGSSDEVLLYPNPATSDVNIVYSSSLDVVNVGVYNIIGKMAKIYKVTGNSANLSLDNLPSGIYFVRLFNSHGDAVATKKFTKQ